MHATWLDTVGSIGAFSPVWLADREAATRTEEITGASGGISSQLGASEVTAGQNLRSFIACGRSGNFISFICCGMFIFFTADTARAGAAVIPACTQEKKNIYQL